MADEKVKIELSVEDAAAANAWLRQSGSLAKYAEELTGIETAHKRSGDAGEAAFRRIGQEVERTAKQFLGVGSAIGGILTFTQLLKREAETARQRQEDIAQRQISFNDAFRRAAGSMVGVQT